LSAAHFGAVWRGLAAKKSLFVAVHRSSGYGALVADVLPGLIADGLQFTDGAVMHTGAWRLRLGGHLERNRKQCCSSDKQDRQPTRTILTDETMRGVKYEGAHRGSSLLCTAPDRLHSLTQYLIWRCNDHEQSLFCPYGAQSRALQRREIFLRVTGVIIFLLFLMESAARPRRRAA
jgi:hypothetical protein